MKVFADGKEMSPSQLLADLKEVGKMPAFVVIEDSDNCTYDLFTRVTPEGDHWVQESWEWMGGEPPTCRDADRDVPVCLHAVQRALGEK